MLDNMIKELKIKLRPNAELGKGWDCLEEIFGYKNVTYHQCCKKRQFIDFKKKLKELKIKYQILKGFSGDINFYIYFNEHEELKKIKPYEVYLQLVITDEHSATHNTLRKIEKKIDKKIEKMQKKYPWFTKTNTEACYYEKVSIIKKNKKLCTQKNYKKECDKDIRWLMVCYNHSLATQENYEKEDYARARREMIEANHSLANEKNLLRERNIHNAWKILDINPTLNIFYKTEMFRIFRKKKKIDWTQ